MHKTYQKYGPRGYRSFFNQPRLRLSKFLYTADYKKAHKTLPAYIQQIYGVSNKTSKSTTKTLLVSANTDKSWQTCRPWQTCDAWYSCLEKKIGNC
jgi:hypothetical protein